MNFLIYGDHLRPDSREDGTLGWPSWKWLFLSKGLHAIVLGINGLRVLTDALAQTDWLSEA